MLILGVFFILYCLKLSGTNGFQFIQSRVGEDLLRGRLTSCFTYGFVIQVISEKTLCSKGFSNNLREIFT